MQNEIWVHEDTEGFLNAERAECNMLKPTSYTRTDLAHEAIKDMVEALEGLMDGYKGSWADGKYREKARKTLEKHKHLIEREER